MKPGPLIIVSGPSGSGKSTVIQRVIVEETAMPLRLAVSATTRAARPGEVDGRAYHFWTKERFEQGLAAGEFLEHAIVHGSHYYGTPRSEVDPHRQQGTGVILDIDVQGAAQVRAMYPEHLSIFVRLADEATYEQRLRARGTESEETITRRMETAKAELARMGEYQHAIYNDELDVAVRQFRELLRSYREPRP